MSTPRLDNLSIEERALVGDATDYEQIEIPPARGARQMSAQFSLRLERPQIQALRRVANNRGLSFSEAAREAIDEYVTQHEPARPSYARVLFVKKFTSTPATTREVRRVVGAVAVSR